MSDAANLTRHLAQRVRSALKDPELRALDALFQLGCRRTERHHQILRDFDWSRLPRSLEFGMGHAGEWNSDQIREAGRAFLMAGIDELIANNGRRGSELEVLRAMKLRLDGVPAQQLGDELESDPQRRRDPKTYRNWIVAYGYAQIREWARGEAVVPGNGHVAGEVPDPATVVDGGPVRGWMRWTAAVVVLVAATVMLYVANRPPQEPVSPGVVDPASGAPLVPLWNLGLHLENEHESPHLPHLEDCIDITTLPNLGSRIGAGVLVPRSDGLRDWPDAYVPLDSVFVALGTANSGTRPGCVALWDAATDSVLWTYEFVQRPGEADMNPDLPSDAGQQSYRLRWMAQSSRYGSLGTDRLVAVFQQKFSPTFAVFLDLRTGKELSRYASYGHLATPLVVDLEGDGSAEVILAGTDNACDAPTVTVLDPSMGDGASSSVSWNTEGEGARWRVVLPDPRALLDGYFADINFPIWPSPSHPRLHTWGLDVRSWDPRTSRLELSVGGGGGQHVYELTLVRGRPSDEVPLIRLGDAEEHVWRSIGLDPSVDPARLAERVVVIEHGDGYGCPEGMEKVELPDESGDR